MPAGIVPPVVVQATPEGAVISGLLTDPVSGQPVSVPVQNVVLVQGEGTALVLAAADAGGTPASLGANGVFAGSFTIPIGLAAGRHTLVFTVAGVSQSLEVVVGGDVPGGRLPATGTDGSGTLWWVLVLVAVGVLLLLDRRRHLPGGQSSNQQREPAVFMTDGREGWQNAHCARSAS